MAATGNTRAWVTYDATGILTGLVGNQSFEFDGVVGQVEPVDQPARSPPRHIRNSMLGPRYERMSAMMRRPVGSG